jgi:RNA polymerase sigma-70 factor (ECF subfamily)
LASAVTVNKTRSHRRRRRRTPATGFELADNFLDRLEAADGDLAREWDEDHDRHVYQRLLELVQNDFHPKTWQAFRRFALDGIPAARVGEEVGLSESALLQAKARILKRLREEAGDFLK